MKKYALAYALGFTPWERYSAAAAESIGGVEPAETAALGWPLSKTDPQWYRLRRSARPPA